MCRVLFNYTAFSNKIRQDEKTGKIGEQKRVSHEIKNVWKAYLNDYLSLIIFYISMIL